MPDSTPAMPPISAALKTLLGLLAVVVVIAAPMGSGWATEHQRSILAWLTLLVGFVALAAIVGRATVGFWLGALIDARNVMSLSRSQLLLWTVLVLSGYVAAALHNVFTRVADPLAVAVPAELWVLMGLSTTSLIGTPLLLSQKAGKGPQAATVEKVREQVDAQGGDPEDVEAHGHLMTNTRPALADWTDLLTGEEASNWFHVDLAKLQMAFVTLAIAAAYAAALWRMFSAPPSGGFTQLPTIDGSAVTLLGISHVGYLANKAVPRQGGD